MDKSNNSNINSLKFQNEFQKILIDISSRCINTPLTEIDESIDTTLKQIGNYVSADRAYIFDYDHDHREATNTHEWCNIGITPQIDNLQNISFDELSDVIEHHSKGDNYIVADVEKLPNGELKEHLSAQDIKSLISVPMMLNNKTIGFIGFDWVLNHNKYTDIQLDLLKLFSQILVNIRSRMLSEQQLTESEERLNLALKGTKAGLWDWHIQTGKTIFNERWANIIGYKLTELEPVSIQTWIDLCHPDDLIKSEKLLNDHFDGKTEYYDFEARMKHKDGHWVWVEDRGEIVERDINGNPIRMIGTHIDITERKKVDELKEDIEKIMHHDLKSPLNNIMMLQHFLKDSPNLTNKERQSAILSLRAGMIMRRIIDMHLDLFKIETGKYIFNPCNLDIVEVIYEVICDKNPASSFNKDDFEVYIDKLQIENLLEQHVVIRAEEHLCYNMLSNLITNAKEAPNTKNTISIYITTKDSVSVTIHNDACVPEEVRATFFDKYCTEGKASGTGLGTYSAKLLAEAQGGTITMQTSKDEGTRVTVSFPKPFQ